MCALHYNISDYRVRGVGDILATAGDRYEQLNLLYGEPWYQPPEEVKQRYARAVLSEPANRYSPPGGDEEFRSALAGYLGGRRSGISAEMVMIGNGSKELLWTVVHSLFGKRVMTGLPAYPGHLAQLQASGCEVMVLPTPSGDGLLTVEALTGISPIPDAILISAPVNPTGADYSPAEATELAIWCGKNGVMLIVDEVYHELRFSQSVSPFLSGDPDWDSLILIRSFSKWLGACGWRSGYLTSSAATVAKLAERQKHTLNPPAVPLQRALAESLTFTREITRRHAKEYQRTCQRIGYTLASAGLQGASPSAGFYLFCTLGDSTLDGRAFCRRLADEGVLVWPGDDFLAGSGVRFSLAGVKPEICDAVATRLYDALGRALR